MISQKLYVPCGALGCSPETVNQLPLAQGVRPFRYESFDDAGVSWFAAGHGTVSTSLMRNITAWNRAPVVTAPLAAASLGQGQWCLHGIATIRSHENVRPAPCLWSLI